MKRKDKKDHGYSWVILAASFLIYMLTIGTIKSFGILYAELLTTYHGSAGNTASIGSMCTFLQSMMGPVANSLSMRFSFRCVGLIGGLLIAVGYLSTSFTNNIQTMFLTYSLVAGVGYGFSFVPSATIVNYYFDKYRGLANGIVVSGSGFGGFLFAYVYIYLLDQYGISGTLIIISGVMLNVCVGAALFRQPEVFTTDKHKPEVPKESKDFSTEETSARQSKCQTLKDIFTFKWSLFKSYVFLAYVVSFAFSVISYGGCFIMLPVFITSSGLPKDDVIWILSIIGIVEVFARIFLGWFADLKILAAHNIYSISMLISGIFTLLLPIFHTFPLLCVYAAIVGTFLGTFYTLLPVLLLEIVSLEDFSSAYALITMCTAVANLIIQPSLGWLEDFTGSWNASFFTTGGLQLASASIIFIMSHCCMNKDLDGKSREIQMDDLEGVSMLPKVANSQNGIAEKGET